MALMPAIFLEKDGTLLADVPYNVDPSRMRFARGAAAGLARLASLGLPLIVVSNQPGIALGKFMPEAMSAVHEELSGMFRQAGAMLGGFYYCPHHPRGVRPGYSKLCECRKPAPGLLHIAAQRQYLDLSHSWFVGDTLDDVEAGRRAGCKTLLVNNGGETEWRRNEWRSPNATASDLYEASQWISDRSVTLASVCRRPAKRAWRPSAMRGMARHDAMQRDAMPMEKASA
jgi:histidinol-phosphate phosphatase family protein